MIKSTSSTANGCSLRFNSGDV